MKIELQKYFRDIENRFSELKNSRDRESFILNLKSLARWNNEPNDYPESTGIEFPNKIHIAHAVCHPECGVQEFIVDGSTQRCQHCGGLLFRNDVVEYKKTNSGI